MSIKSVKMKILKNKKIVFFSCPGVYILQIFFQVIWGRFSRHNIRVASQKEGEGKKKGKRGRKKGKRGKKKGKRGRKRVREEEKRGRGEEKRCSGKGRKYFMC